MGLILKRPRSSFFILRKMKKMFSFYFKSSSEFQVLKYGFVVSYAWYNFFRLGLVSQSDKNCKLYQVMITKWT